jgi:pantothenate kinase
MHEISSSSIDALMIDTYREMARKIESIVLQSERQIIIGIAGPPGSGKTTTAKAIVNLISGSILLPMDGYHFTKEQLGTFKDPENAFRRRGSHWTFDVIKFVRDIAALKTNKFGDFPSFDHGVGDPVANDIHVTVNHRVVVVEGNYLLQDSNPWSLLKDYFDFSYFIDCPISVVESRVFNRHVAIGQTEEQAAARVATNDRLNALEIMTCRHRADICIQSL